LPPINWIVEELLPEGLAVLAGRPKVGKSWMALDIAIAVSNGYQTMGFFDTKKHDVFFIPYEDNFRRLQGRINRILGGGITERAPTNLYYPKDNFEFPKLNETGLDEIERIIDNNPNIKLIVVDTLGRGIADKGRKDRSMYHADYELSSAIQKLAISRKICILLLHHTRKEKSENVFDEISGTTGLTAGLDTMLVLKKNENKHRLYVTGRDVVENEYNLEFDESNCIWRAEKKISEAKLTVEREEIFDLIKSFGRKMKTGEIAEALGKSKSNISKMLGKMVNAGTLISVSYGIYDLPQELREAAKNDTAAEGKEQDDTLFSDRP
jgi:RecA-family ATPase